MKTCPACGADVYDDAERCTSCDAPLDGATESFQAVGESGGPTYHVDAESITVPVLVVRKGVEVGERFHLDQPRISIGRDPGSGIFLNDVTVSRHHAVLRVSGTEVEVEDVGSLNGTYVNDSLVERETLAAGDTVQIGRFQMVFLSGGAS